MPRPQRCRRICGEPEYCCFIPDKKETGVVVLSLDEYEVVRLIDLKCCTHEECAQIMEISRTTVSEIYESARFKIADSLVNGRRLIISGGNYRLCEGSSKLCCGRPCPKMASEEPDYSGGEAMIIAVTYENGEVFQHFGHTEAFKLYETGVANSIIREEVVSTNGQGHSALADFLVKNNVRILICGGIGGGAQAALKEAGIILYAGISGNADAAVKALMDGTLEHNPAATCHHHDGENGEHHHCGEHGCGEHSCH